MIVPIFIETSICISRLILLASLIVFDFFPGKNIWIIHPGVYLQHVCGLLMDRLSSDPEIIFIIVNNDIIIVDIWYDAIFIFFIVNLLK